MIPASRTPEGDQIHCPICGAESRISPSRPPGDVPCPSCGSLLWSEPVSPQVELQTVQISAAVARLASSCRNADANRPRQVLAYQLTSLLNECLGARGAMLWSCSRSGWLRKGWRLSMECAVGQLTDASSSFAQGVARTLEARAELANQGREPILLLGVPLRHDDELCGVVEVMQRPTASEATRRGYLTFMQQMAQLVGDSHAYARRPRNS